MMHVLLQVGPEPECLCVNSFRFDPLLCLWSFCTRPPGMPTADLPSTRVVLSSAISMLALLSPPLRWKCHWGLLFSRRTGYRAT